MQLERVGNVGGGEKRGAFGFIKEYQISDITPGFKSLLCPFMEYRLFSKHELARYNGKNGAPAYVAVQGKIYDVTESFLWLGGRHQVLHYAGADLTVELPDAPHGLDVFEKFPIVGLLMQ